MVLTVNTKVICQSPSCAWNHASWPPMLHHDRGGTRQSMNQPHHIHKPHTRSPRVLPTRQEHDPLHHLTLGNRLVLIPPQKRLLNRNSLENRSVSGDFSSQGALRCVVAVAFSCRSCELGSFTGYIALATIGLNFALHPVRSSHIDCRSARTWDTDACVADLLQAASNEAFKGLQKDRVPTSRSLRSLPCVCLCLSVWMDS